MDYLALERNISTLLNEIVPMENGKLPHDFDFNSGIGYYFNIINLGKNDYRNEATLDVCLSFKKEYKVQATQMVSKIDHLLLKRDFENYWITHKNVWFVKINNDDVDKNTMTFVLTYSIHIY